MVNSARSTSVAVGYHPIPLSSLQILMDLTRPDIQVQAERPTHMLKALAKRQAGPAHQTLTLSIAYGHHRGTPQEHLTRMRLTGDELQVGLSDRGHRTRIALPRVRGAKQLQQQGQRRRRLMDG